MQMIYNSSNYVVVEFAGSGARSEYSGFEIMDKNTQRELFLDGVMAENFRKCVQELIDTDPSLEEVDDFLGQFDPLIVHPIVIH